MQEKRGGTPQCYVPAQYRFFEKINQNVNDTYRIGRERHLSAQVTYITPTDLVLHIIVYCFIVNMLFMSILAQIINITGTKEVYKGIS